MQNAVAIGKSLTRGDVWKRHAGFFFSLGRVLHMITHDHWPDPKPSRWFG